MLKAAGAEVLGVPLEFGRTNELVAAFEGASGAF
jgi:hypothetical protein